MSWLFGKKKNKESPTDSSEEANSSNQADEYVIIENNANPFVPSPADGIPPSNQGGLYPFLGGGMSSPTFVPQVPSRHTAPNDTQSYLSGVPFQLNKMFENDREIERIQVDEIFASLLRAKSEDYDYDFGLEKSVIAEMDSTSE